MSSILEDFRLDLADDNDIEYSVINKSMSLMISAIIEDLPGRVARQKIVNRFAQIVREDREAAEEMVMEVVNNQERVVQFLVDCKKARHARSMDRSLKSMNKLISQLQEMC